VGLNGAGKTTLTKLLAGLYQPDRGGVTVDGVDLCELDIESWRRRLAVIFQDFIHYELSVAANVGYGRIDRFQSGAPADTAARRAGAHSVVERLPEGWETMLSVRFGGVELSGGEWQRIALARTFYAVEGGAGVLVLDEPTAHLDVRAEADLFARFLELTAGLTTILITHRLASVRHADRIVLIGDGRIVEDGSHAELIAAGGAYAEMFRMQAERFDD
jgi:ATP-binding cassette subfamily B protein